jgi:polyhydroxybutyrate depolymerase
MAQILSSCSLIAACAALLVACSGESEPLGESSSTGGSAGSSGTAGGSGGTGTAGQGAGGSPSGGTAGAVSTGGTGAGAGASAGGSAGANTGGSTNASTGGSFGGGGTDAGSSGGSAGSGGSNAGGSGGGGSKLSAGCGAANPPTSGRKSITVNGATREYVLDVPNPYDANKPHLLIFGWHWMGGKAQDVVSNQYYGLKPLSNGTAIFVSPEGLVDNGNTGWANPNGRDVEFAKAMLEKFKAELCIDESLIFSTGFSYGGMMSNALGCAMGDVFRAIAPYAGALYSGCASGTAPVAVWGTHATNDGVVPIANGRAARDEFLKRNGCGTQTVPTQPNQCVTYQGCKEGYPVTWCEWTGDHQWPQQWAPQPVWEFFNSFK